MSSVTIEFSIPVGDIVSANGREHHMKVAGKAKRLRTNASWWAAHAWLQERTIGVLMERAELTVSVGWQPLKRRRDATNLGPTLKPIIDGCVDAKILRDDDDLHLLKVTTQTYNRSDAGLVWLRLDFVDADA